MPFCFFNDSTENGSNFETNSTWLFNLGLGLAGAAIFYLGNLWGRSQAALDNNRIAKRIEEELAAQLVKGGWRPKRIHIGGVSFYISYFKPALFGSVAFPVVRDKQRNKQYLLLNIQKREVSPGNIKEVIDFPRGFYQSNSPDLAFKQEVLKRVGIERKKNDGKMSSEILKGVLKKLHQELDNKELELKSKKADRDVIATAVRELEEETGQRGLILDNARHFGTVVIQNGSFIYNLVELKYDAESQVDFEPEIEENIVSSHLIEISEDNFRFYFSEKDQRVQGQVYIEGQGWKDIKPYDNNACMLAAYLQKFHSFKLQDVSEHIQDMEQPILDSKYEHSDLPLDFSL